MPFIKMEIQGHIAQHLDDKALQLVSPQMFCSLYGELHFIAHNIFPHRMVIGKYWPILPSWICLMIPSPCLDQMDFQTDNVLIERPERESSYYLVVRLLNWPRYLFIWPGYVGHFLVDGGVFVFLLLPFIFLDKKNQENIQMKDNGKINICP